MSGHTPGPWTIKRDTGRMPSVIKGADGQSVAGIYWDELAMDDPDAESGANARLIAAAPDLLEALEKIQSIARGDRDDDYEDDDEATADIDAIARAAIAKALAT